MRQHQRHIEWGQFSKEAQGLFFDGVFFRANVCNTIGLGFAGTAFRRSLGHIFGLSHQVALNRIKQAQSQTVGYTHSLDLHTHNHLFLPLFVPYCAHKTSP
jgi:hypothetical protein